MTDVTGFGLLGHALEVCRGSGLAAEIDADAPELLPGVEALARAGVRTGAAVRNWASYGEAVEPPTGMPEWRRDILCDPQTSGGLLAAVAADRAEAVMDLVRSRGFDRAAVVGRLVEGEPWIRVTAG
jgi:selenide,water dikinase